MSKNGFKIIANECVGYEYGCVPGHQYDDVWVSVSKRGKVFRAEIKQVWGNNQGFREQHGKIEVSARGYDAQEVLEIAMSRAKETTIYSNKLSREYLLQAFCKCEDALADALAEALEISRF